jgi:hypothetical protein
MLAAVVGCDSSSSTTPAPAESQKLPPYPGPGAKGPLKPEDVKPEQKKAADAKPAKPLDVAGTKLSDDEIKEISKIEPEAERKIALEQKLCPSSGDHLGSMETPVKVTIKGQTVFLCCAGCKKEAEAKPDEMLAKLGK